MTLFLEPPSYGIHVLYSYKETRSNKNATDLRMNGSRSEAFHIVLMLASNVWKGILKLDWLKLLGPHMAGGPSSGGSTLLRT
jgi:hypothetical protein